MILPVQPALGDTATQLITIESELAWLAIISLGFIRYSAVQPAPGDTGAQLITL